MRFEQSVHRREIDQMIRNGYLIATMTFAALWLMGGTAVAQEGGSAERGRILARQICSQCHATEKTQPLSPNTAPPRFETVANVPGMTAAALSVALQRSHETMPNVILDANQ